MSKHKINYEVKKKYSFYQTLLKGIKNLTYPTIILDDLKGTKKDWKIKSVDAKHIHLHDEHVVFTVESKVNDDKNFKFALKCNNLSDTPFFRFDSDGAAHKNAFFEIPLKNQQVTTPHFHKYDENGQCIAYKTEKLKDEKESKALEDINLCIIHFCHESHLRYQMDNFPTIEQNPSELPLKLSNDDPLQNIKFA